ncbi:LysM domain/BON superfamily protein [Tritonibacter horizontis]|uniref:LysM domain/BON superfamily protein n=1 Tax=Tritonibacter horizontis TaxID=1768241 RepID=A0A132C1I8_9RHOB|nr:LysM domain/BON superfamily protein [Tritonibacter horizontis]
METAQLPTAEAAQSSPQPTAPSDIAATTPAEPAAPGTEQAVSPAVTPPVTTAPQATAEAGAEPDAAAQEDAVVADAASAPRPEVAVAVLRANKDGVTLVQPATPVAPELLDKIALDTISYTDAGDVQLAGRARPEALVRVYLDNSPVADITADAAGRWSGSLTAITPGIYTLRLDEIDPIEGKVLSRLETPFKREAPEVLQPVLDANAAAADAGQPAVQAVTVQKGDTLWAISQERYGSGFLFVRVFEANKSDIRDPDLIYPGQIFTLPD